MRPAHRTHVATTVCGVVIIAVLTAFFMVPPGWRSRTVLVYNEFLGAYYVFGFDAGGHLDMSASVSNGLEVHMVVCRDDQFDRVARTGVDALCEDLNATATLCDFFATANPVHPAHFEGSMDSDLYFFAYLNCKSGTGTAAITIEAVNPGGEHLSTTLQPYKAGTVVFLAIMAFMAISWGATLLAHRQRLAVLHYWILAVPVAETLRLAAYAWLWYTLSAHGSVPIGQLVVVTTAAVMAEATFCYVLLLMAAGYCITVNSLSDNVWRSVQSMAFIYAFSLFTFFVFTTYFFLFLFLICCAIVLRFAFLALRVNQSILAVQALRARARSIELDVTPIPGQRRLFERLRYSILAYFLVEMAFRLWSLSLVIRTPWLSFFCEMGTTVLFLAVMNVVMRPRRRSLFFDRSGVGIPHLEEPLTPPSMVYVQNPADSLAVGRITTSATSSARGTGYRAIPMLVQPSDEETGTTGGRLYQ